MDKDKFSPIVSASITIGGFLAIPAAALISIVAVGIGGITAVSGTVAIAVGVVISSTTIIITTTATAIINAAAIYYTNYIWEHHLAFKLIVRLLLGRFHFNFFGKH